MSSGQTADDPVDLLVIGGGINGCGIARDAAGRGLSVILVEQDDLAGHTSSASTKLVHGGLRYLEHRAFRLVREALAEREVLLRIAPHIIWPMRFVLPHDAGMRPAWMLGLGLFLYDHIGRRRALPASETLAFNGTGLGAGLRPSIAQGFAYSDCWVEDSRLVILNAVDAAERGAHIRTRTRLLSARRDGPLWAAQLEDGRSGQRATVMARRLVNAAGPWVSQVLHGALGRSTAPRARLVKGSHIVVPRLYPGEHAYLLQNPDKRVIFAIPYEHDFTLIGTTDLAWTGDVGSAAITEAETDYLCAAANRWLRRAVTPAQVVWSFAGIRPLHDDGSKVESDVTRDYVLELEAPKGAAPALSVFGGKITTYRKLAEHALRKLKIGGKPWTAGAALTGGDLPGGDFERFLGTLMADKPFLPERQARRLARAYGTRAYKFLGGSQSLGDLGEDLGAGLTEAELDYLIAQEFARSADDVLWRRSKLGLRATPGMAERLARHPRLSA